MSSVEDVLSRSPFLRSTLSPDEIRRNYGLFIQGFENAVLTTDEDEEAWAYERCKGAYRRLMGNPPPSREDPKMPAGFFEAMQWAAELMTAERPSSPR